MSDFKDLYKKIHKNLPDNNRQEITARDLREVLNEMTCVMEHGFEHLHDDVKRNAINIQFVDSKMSTPGSINGTSLKDESLTLDKIVKGEDKQVISVYEGTTSWKFVKDLIDEGSLDIKKLTNGEEGYVLVSTTDGVEWSYVADVIVDGTIDSLKIKSGEEGQLLTTEDGKTIWKGVSDIVTDGSLGVNKLVKGEDKDVLVSTTDGVEWGKTVDTIDDNTVDVSKLVKGEDGQVLFTDGDEIVWKGAEEVIPAGSVELEKLTNGEKGQLLVSGDEKPEWTDLKDIINISNGSAQGSLQQESNVASEMYSFAEGNDTNASGFASHAEGHHTISTKHGSHAEGRDTKANADYSHAEGSETETRGENSHAEGLKTIAYGENSHAEGEGTQTLNKNEHAEGQWNKSNHETHEFPHKENTTLSVGIGSSELDRKNAFEIMQNGDIYVIGMGEYDGTNAREEESSTLQVVMQDEIDRATQAEEELDEKIDAETERAENKETELDNKIDVEQSRAENAELTLRTSIDGISIVREDDGGYDANHADVYHLEVDGQQKGQKIVIRKDNTLRSVYLGHVDDRLDNENSETVISGTGNTALCFIYYVNGKYELVAVDVEHFLSESEFKDGLIVENHEVRVRIDSTSEGFLTVSPEGVKLDGVQTYVDNKVKEEDDRASEAERVLDGKVEGEKVRAESAEGVLDGKIESEIDRATQRENEINDRLTSAGNTFDGRLNTLEQPLMVGQGGKAGQVWTNTGMGAKWADVEGGVDLPLERGEGEYSVIMKTDSGSENKVIPVSTLGKRSVVFGERNETNYNNSLIVGDRNKLIWSVYNDQTSSVIFGKSNEAKGNLTFTFGKSNKQNYGESVFTAGDSNDIQINKTIILGYNNVVPREPGIYREKAFIFGDNLTTNNNTEFAFGIRNNPHKVTGDDLSTGTFLSVGLGLTSGINSNVIEIMRNGDIYINGVGGYDGQDFESAKTLQEVVSEIKSYTGNYIQEIKQEGGSISFKSTNFRTGGTDDNTINFKTINGQSPFGMGDIVLYQVMTEDEFSKIQPQEGVFYYIEED